MQPPRSQSSFISPVMCIWIILKCWSGPSSTCVVKCWAKAFLQASTSRCLRCEASHPHPGLRPSSPDPSGTLWTHFYPWYKPNGRGKHMRWSVTSSLPVQIKCWYWLVYSYRVTCLPFAVGGEIVHFFNIDQLDYVTRHRHTNMPCGIHKHKLGRDTAK